MNDQGDKCQGNRFQRFQEAVDAPGGDLAESAPLSGGPDVIDVGDA